MRPAGTLRSMEDRPPPLQPLMSCRRVGAGVRYAGCRPRQSVSDDRQHHRPRSPAGSGRKRGAQDQALGRSRGGLTTKIQMLADTFAHPLRFLITPGQPSDIAAAPDLLSRQTAGAVLADKDYDSNDLRERIAGMKAKAVIPSKRNRKLFIPHDASIYKHRKPNRTMLRPTQTFPPLRNPISPTRRTLQQGRSSRCCHDLPTLNVDRL
ncbi:Transposase DDE domain-containing protein [Sphingobium faniae]|nr:Transposase DDE domain-containing protein [Sphingobium faniae]